MTLYSLLKIDILSGLPHLDRPTYNYPCVKTGVDKSKPTCSKFYSMWVSAPSRNQKLFIEELKLSKPKFILYGSEKDLYGDTHERLSTVLSFIDNNYSFHSKFKSWTFVKINLDY